MIVVNMTTKAMTAFLLMITFLSCSPLKKEGKDKPPVDIKWSKTSLNFDNQFKYSLDSIEKKMIFFGSNKRIHGGAYISIVEGSRTKRIYTTTSSTISDPTVMHSKVILFRESILSEQNRLNSILVMSNNLGISWDTVSLPIKSLGRLFVKGKTIFIQGNENGHNAIYFSSDNGTNWQNINMFSQGYKSFYVVSEGSNANSILCNASKHYSSKKKNKLVEFYWENLEVKDIESIDDQKFVQIACKSSVFSMQSENELTFYKSDKHGNYKNIKSVKLNLGDKLIRNVYYDKDFVILTSGNRLKSSQDLSWITYDSGQTWLPYMQNLGFQLVENVNGSLVVVDNNNTVLFGKVTQSSSPIED